MLFSELCDREVININDCRCMGHIRDLEIDSTCGKICAIVVPGPGKYLGCFCREYDFFIPWAKVIKIGPDIIIVDLDDKEMRRKI